MNPGKCLLPDDEGEESPDKCSTARRGAPTDRPLLVSLVIIMLGVKLQIHTS